MTLRTMTGQDIVDMTNDLLGGYQNAIDSRALMTHINLAKDSIWEILSQLKDELFQVKSQSTNSSADFYFAPLVAGTTDYTLPDDLRSLEYVECTNPNFTGIRFVYKKNNDPDFRAQRNSYDEQPSTSGYGDQTFFYTIMGRNQFVLAKAPSQALTLVLWYTRAIPDFETSDTITEILFPYSKHMAQFAAKSAMLSAQDPAQFAIWKADWRDAVINMVQGAGARNDADATFVQDFDDC